VDFAAPLGMSLLVTLHAPGEPQETRQAHPNENASFNSGGIYFRGVRADPAEIADIRRAIRQWLRTLPLEDERRDDVVLASYEALANAVEHAYSAQDDSATLDLEATYRPQDRYLEVRVSDRGSWHEAVVPNGSRGHGLNLIRQLSTDMVVTPRPDGTQVAMHWTL
jgi:serine/threonine-protein kinase RsbW